MNQTGTYVYAPGQGLVRVSPPGYVPPLARPVYAPKGDLPHYDRSARCKFESKAEKRAWLKRWGLREGGLITNPDKRWEGTTRNSAQRSWESKRDSAKRRTYIQSQGGVNGLLDKIAHDKQVGGGRYV